MCYKQLLFTCIQIFMIDTLRCLLPFLKPLSTAKSRNLHSRSTMSITTYGLQDIKKEIQHLNNAQVAELCLRVARFKKENKELLAYLLFEAANETAFIEKVKAEVGFIFSQLPSQSYNAAKST